MMMRLFDRPQLLPTEVEVTNSTIHGEGRILQEFNNWHESMILCDIPQAIAFLEDRRLPKSLCNIIINYLPHAFFAQTLEKFSFQGLWDIPENTAVIATGDGYPVYIPYKKQGLSIHTIPAEVKKTLVSSPVTSVVYETEQGERFCRTIFTVPYNRLGYDKIHSHFYARGTHIRDEKCPVRVDIEIIPANFDGSRWGPHQIISIPPNRAVQIELGGLSFNLDASIGCPFRIFKTHLQINIKQVRNIIRERFDSFIVEPANDLLKASEDVNPDKLRKLVHRW
ncbi:MAG: hypothetical protein ACYCQI_09935 [Gammaproteobacteria bacterium]